MDYLLRLKDLATRPEFLGLLIWEKYVYRVLPGVCLNLLQAFFPEPCFNPILTHTGTRASTLNSQAPHLRAFTLPLVTSKINFFSISSFTFFSTFLTTMASCMGNFSTLHPELSMESLRLLCNFDAMTTSEPPKETHTSSLPQQPIMLTPPSRTTGNKFIQWIHQLRFWDNTWIITNISNTILLTSIKHLFRAKTPVSNIN